MFFNRLFPLVSKFLVHNSSQPVFINISNFHTSSVIKNAPIIERETKSITETIKPKPITLKGLDIVREDSLETTIIENKVYNELPIVHMSSKKNNLILCLSDCNGRSLSLVSCGTEGFQNARKNTTVAAQTVGISLGLKAQRLGVEAVRVKMRGIFSNRMPALTGLVLSGVKIVSITDDTRFHLGHGKRPRKVRRV